MKALLLHAEEYGVSFHSFANRPKGVFLEDLNGNEEQTCTDCVVALISIEKGDEIKAVRKIVGEIEKMCNEIKRNKAVVVPFAHLSNNLGDPKKSFDFLEKVELYLKEDGFKVMRTHFGSNKSLHLDVYGHAGNARFREF